VFIFSVKVKEIKEKDEIFYLFTMSDITEIDKLRQKAEELAKAKSEFLANMSHEIRTPMNAILGFAKLLEKEKSQEKQKKYLEIINKSATHLLEIINDILDFSKLQSGKMELDITNVNPYEEFARCVMLFTARAKEKNITLDTDIDINIPECLKFDPVRMQQILSNLIGNAIKFTPEGGKVVLYAKLIKKDDKKAKIKIGVKDTGIGISKEAQNL
jgi:signal transduction histidine kinase